MLLASLCLLLSFPFSSCCLLFSHLCMSSAFTLNNCGVLQHHHPPFRSQGALHEREEKGEKKHMSKGKESRESNAKLKAFSKALETAGCPGDNLKNLPRGTVKEKVWQGVCDTLHIHKDSEKQHFDFCTTLCIRIFQWIFPFAHELLFFFPTTCQILAASLFVASHFVFTHRGNELNSPSFLSVFPLSSSVRNHTVQRTKRDVS